MTRTDITWASRIEASTGGGRPGFALGAPDGQSAAVVVGQAATYGRAASLEAGVVTVSRTVSPILQIYRDSAAQTGPRHRSPVPNRLQTDNF